MNVSHVAVALIDVGERFRKDDGKLDDLESSIKSVGLLHPIVVTNSWKLIAGGRRLAVAKRLGWAEIPCQVLDLDNILQAELDENTCRKDMTVSEKTALAEALEKTIKKKQGKRNDIDEKTTCARRSTSSPSKQKTRDKVAEKSGFASKDELARAKLVKEKCCESVRELVDDGTVSLTDAASIAEYSQEVQEKAIDNMVYGATTTLKKGAELALKQIAADAGTAEAIRDCHNLIIPDHLLTYHGDIALFDEALQVCESLRFKLNHIDKCPTSNYRAKGNLQGHLKMVEEDMKASRFWCVCPACDGSTDKNCEVCQNRRFFQAHDNGKVNLKKFLK